MVVVVVGLLVLLLVLLLVVLLLSLNGDVQKKMETTIQGPGLGGTL